MYKEIVYISIMSRLVLSIHVVYYTEYILLITVPQSSHKSLPHQFSRSLKRHSRSCRGPQGYSSWSMCTWPQLHWWHERKTSLWWLWMNALNTVKQTELCAFVNRIWQSSLFVHNTHKYRCITAYDGRMHANVFLRTGQPVLCTWANLFPPQILWNCSPSILI